MDTFPVLVGFVGCWARDNRPAHGWTQGMSSESEMNAEQGAGNRVLWGAGGDTAADERVEEGSGARWP